MKKTLSIWLAAGAVFGVLAGGVAQATVLKNRGDLPAPVYKVNSHGMTFGSGLDATSPGDEPALIEAIGVDGTQGYVRSADLLPPEPNTPAQAVSEGRAAAARTITLYAQDGVTAIGKFVLPAPARDNHAKP